jgi:hypothetical protein
MRFRVALAVAVWASVITAQERPITSGPTIGLARSAFSVASPGDAPIAIDSVIPESCGSMLRNGLLMGIGFSLATASLELLYTLVREPFVRQGHDVARADPRWIAWAGGAGFVVGLIATERCRRRRG